MPISILLDSLEQFSKAEEYTEVDFVDLSRLIYKEISFCAENVLDNKDDNLQKFIVTTIIRYAKKKVWADYSADYSMDDFSLLATLIPLITNKNKARILKVAEELRKKNTNSFSKERRDEAYLLFTIQTFLKLGQRKQAEELMNTNIDNDNIRLFKINLAYMEKEFTQAERLALEITNNPKHNNVRYLCAWYDCLDTIYRETNQVQKIINSLKKEYF